jgi:hypothetical protein
MAALNWVLQFQQPCDQLSHPTHVVGGIQLQEEVRSCLLNSPVTEFADGIMMRRGLSSRKEGYSRNCSQCESL